MKKIAVATAMIGCLAFTTSTTHAQDKGPHDGAIMARQAMFQL